MNDPKEEIKRRLGIVEVISAYVKLQKAGTNYKALCPFHNEKTPSFTVSPDKDMWYCFGCGEGGDLFTFVQKIEGMEFLDALKLLAEKAGVELRPHDKQLSSKRNTLLEIAELSTKFFEKQLESTTGNKVRSYLNKRGLTPATVAGWRLGYAPDSWDALTAFLKKRGFSEEDQEAVGLTIKSEKAVRDRRHHDRFRHRIIFPIFSLQGQVVGFSGRLFEEVASKTAGKEAAKYINTPTSALYDKSHILYGLDRAKVAMKHEDGCVLVEGNVDVILAHQAGTQHAVAPCGTAVGRDHFAIIKRYTPNIAFCFDSDNAGIKATKKSAHVALTEGLNVSVIELPKEKDVADVISESPQKWQEHISQPVSFISFVMKAAKEGHNLKSAQGKKEYAQEVLTTIRAVASPVEQEHWIQELTGEAGMSEKALREEMARLPEQAPEAVGPAPLQEAGTEGPEEDAPQAVEEYFAALALKDPETFKKIAIESYGELFESDRVRAMLDKLYKGEDPNKLAAKDENIRPLMFAAELLEAIIDAQEIPHEMARILIFLKKRHVRRQLNVLQQELARAEKADDSARVKKLLSSFNDLTQKLLEYDRAPAPSKKQAV